MKCNVYKVNCKYGVYMHPQYISLLSFAMIHNSDQSSLREKGFILLTGTERIHSIKSQKVWKNNGETNLSARKQRKNKQSSQHLKLFTHLQ